MNKKALWITCIAIIVIAVLIAKGGVAPYVPPTVSTGETPSTIPSDENVQPSVPQGKLPAGSAAPGNPAALVGTWVWQKTVMSDGSVITPKKPGVFALTLTSDGRASGKTDCNGFGGDYKVGSDGVLTFGPFMSTLMYCEGSQEGEFNGPLSKAQRYSFDAAGNLTIGLEEGAGAVVFTRQ